MTLISYSQNLEDVVLWRALGHIKSGFYIDVGACSPIVDSVTKAFYEKGWQGINIEPLPEYFEELKADRQRDINLCIALSDRTGEATLNLLSIRGLSTLDEEIAKQHVASGCSLEKLTVTVSTLEEVWKKYVPVDGDVHFLKIDVEGLERQVICGNDWDNYRPWILVVEATVPMSQTETHAEWESIILGHAYRFAYADGLNRFYVAEEQSVLLDSFEYPPNVFDQFKRYSHVVMETQLLEIENSRKRAQEQIQLFDIGTTRSNPEIKLEGNAQMTLMKELSGQIRALQASMESVANKVESNQSEVLSLRREMAGQKLNAQSAVHPTMKHNQMSPRTEKTTAQLQQSIDLWRNAALANEKKIQALKDSLSWRITAPLRAGLNCLKRAVSLFTIGPGRSAFRRRIRKTSNNSAQDTTRASKPSPPANAADAPSNLLPEVESPEVRFIYQDLKDAVQRRNGS